MKIEISGNSRCIKIVFDRKLVALNKQQVKSMDMMGNDKVRIDMGEGALNHIYVNAADVTVPNKFTDAASLLDFFVDLWVKGLDCCNDTKVKMDKQLSELTNIKTVLQDIRADLKPVLPTQPDIFAAPRNVDETQPDVIYSGYAAQNVAANIPGWAIKQTFNQNGNAIELWSNGSKVLDNVWDNRYNINYLPLSTATV